VSYADVVTQMQAIQTQLAQLGLAGTAATKASSTANATTFASALDSAASAPAVSTATTASTDGTLISPNGVTGDDVVQAALAYKGVPYVLGGESKGGIDCSGLVQAAFKKLGIDVPRLVHQQQTVGQEVDSLKDAQPGDLIVLNGGDHIAIYMGNDTVLHAPYPGRTVSVQKAWFDDSDITSIRRIVPATDGATATTGTGTAATTGAASGILGSTDGTIAGIGGTSTSGLSAATIAQATAMLTTYGADVGLYSTDASGSDGSGTSLASLLSSFGLTGTSTTGGTSSSAATQQLIAARSALLEASA
jgi:peptidoglycan DL-endopeptidase CwlO